MEYKQLGSTKERIPEIGFGTWKMLSGTSDIEAIQTAIKHGSNLIDTAEMYGNEELVGEAIKGAEGVFIATKVSPHNFHYDDVLKACDTSLRKLGVKQIDLYQLHWPNHSIPISETMRAMEQLKKDGKIRHIGVSNFDVREFEEAQGCLKNDEIVSNQVEYSILVRDIEKDILGFCKKNKVTVIAYSPFARGALFSNRYKPLIAKLSAIGENHEKDASQVALNWLIEKDGVIAIPKSSDKHHAITNAEASGWRMTSKEISELEHSLSEIRKRPITSMFAPMIKRSGFWSRYMTSRRQRKQGIKSDR